MSEQLGKTSFLDTPDVNGSAIITATSLNTTLTNLVVPGTEGLSIPAGTSVQRPVAPILGGTRYNTTISIAEIWTGSAWLPIGKIIQSVSGGIPTATGSVAGKATTATIPAAGDRGLTIWSTTFTPLVIGSSVVIQYSCVGTHAAGASRALYTSCFVGANVVGSSIGGGVVAQATTAGVGAVNLILQAVYTTTSTAAVTIAAYLGHILSATAVTISVNQVGPTGTLGGTLATQYRILEII